MIGSQRKRHQAAIQAAAAGTPTNQAVTDNFATGGHRKFAEFGQRIVRVRMVARFEFNADEEDPFGPRFSGFDERFQRLQLFKSENPPRSFFSFCSTRACRGRRK